MASISDIAGGFPAFFLLQFVTRALSSSTANAGDLSGSPLCILNNSGGTPGSLTTRTATQMLADSGLAQGQQWQILLVNGQGTGTLTLVAGSGVTVNGTATVAVNTARLFNAQVTGFSTPAIVMTGLAMSFTATGLAFGV